MRAKGGASRPISILHRILVAAFENRLSLKPEPGTLQTGDRVLESGVGTGIWAIEFFEKNKEEGTVLDIECIDISDKQFPKTHLPNIHLSIHSVIDLPREWSGTFSYAHQRLLILSLNDGRWRKALNELFRVLAPGGWVELLEHDSTESSFGVGPYSKKLVSLLSELFADKGLIANLKTYLPSILEEVGFVDIRWEARRFSIGSGDGYQYPSKQWQIGWLGAKQSMVKGGYVQSGEEYEEIMEKSNLEWENSTKANTKASAMDVNKHPSRMDSDLKDQRYYASQEYILPADQSETRRLNLQHRTIVRAYENRLFLAPVTLNSGDRVLESGAGTGIWAFEFFRKNEREGIVLDIECTDISDQQFPEAYPPNIHFSVHSVIELPREWTGTFSYVHQRLLIGALDDSRWRKALSELFRVLAHGGWVELVEHDATESSFDVGPHSKKLVSLLSVMYADRGIISNLGTYLPRILEEVGFVDVHWEARRTTIGPSEEDGYRSEEFREIYMGMKQAVVNAGGYGFVQTGEEYAELLQGSTKEWNDLNGEANYGFYSVFARKP
ncbi:hypothetical protein D9757_007409 [Collybiopsis confluens]|uniref:S-adenosyl-L-methionine-dependent methyltransferase n=1 Tax=Collybiopsis confluens TaxID=2823264 RepID=A0A8H5HJ43_9AGAR|nr:hypothetical protein D9757_007409 [Collybiopsis confluens]